MFDYEQCVGDGFSAAGCAFEIGLIAIPGAIDNAAPAARTALFSRGGARTNAEILENGGGLSRTIDTVMSHAEAGGVGLDGVEIVLVSDAETIRYLDLNGAVAYAGENAIYLGPAAFSDAETLVRTLAHERQHVFQLTIWSSGLEMNHALEAAAYAAETSYWDYYQLGFGPR